ncbi:GP158 protein, partial [Eolophus roseicapillus]|nr:GP158 protein [Eolophus roseicapilla]
CRPCRQGCSTCEDDAPCLIQEDRALRAAVLSCQACCMLAIFLSMLVSYHFRRSKARSSGIILLETILFGSLLLYFPVFILYFKPSIFRCIVLRWVRMLGFTIVYGTITLKLYRYRDGGGWMLVSPATGTHWGSPLCPLQGAEGVPVPHGPAGALCVKHTGVEDAGADPGAGAVVPGSLDHWDAGEPSLSLLYPTAELLFLLWGSFLCYATRAVPSAFHEPRYMGIALHNELMISATFHVVRIQGNGDPSVSGPELSPCPPQFLHTGSPLREEITAEVYEDELDMRRSGSCLNSSIASAWSEHSLDPDDIREELKKLYRQLEVHRTWRMAAHNPHLPKQRSARRSLARSIARR